MRERKMQERKMQNATTGGEAYARTKYREYPVREDCELLDFLMREGYSRNKAKDILQGHGVMVDRRLVTRHDHPLRAGQTVLVSRHRRKTELESQWLKIIYEDKDIVVIDKQPGILSMGTSARQFTVKTVLDEYFERRHFQCHAHVVHRLDRDTSGLMVYAKTIEAARVLERDWKGRVFDRRYVALVSGVIEQEGGTLESYLKDDQIGVTRSSPTDNDGKLATTHFRVVERLEGRTLVELRLETGRKNQIRVQMADLGHPVCGDKKYGLRGDDPIHRLCLHAYRLYLYHPTTGLRMEFETPYPTAFRRLG